MAANEEEEERLLEGSEEDFFKGSKLGLQVADSLDEDSEEEWDEDWEDLESAKKEDHKLLSDGKARGVSLIVQDCVWLFFHYLQLLALMQSLSLRWTWPDKWLRATHFLFLFNLDIREFSKFTNSSTYISVQKYYIPSKDLEPVKYWYILAGWAGGLAVGTSVFLLALCVIKTRKRSKMIVQIAQLRRIGSILLEFLSIPLGVAVAKVFHCTDKGVLDIDNDIPCISFIHWAYIGVAIGTFVVFMLFPIWMMLRTRSEMLGMTPDRHEGYLQLKETEYIQGLDMFYVIGNFHLFSSFRKKAAYFRPAMFYLNLLLIVVYALLNNQMFLQAVIINCYFLVLFITFIMLQPYRVSCFNHVLVVSYLCLTANALLGSMVTTFNPFTLRSPYLTKEYVLVELMIINSFWLLCFFIFVVYLLSRHFGCCKNCCKKPLWPSMTSDGIARLTPETRKYVRAVLNGRTFLESILKMPALFAPVHELGHHIQVINVYCREAEFTRDPIHDTLWDLLDEMIAANERIAPHSLYSENSKESTKVTVEELKSLIPMFARRLAQREYDLLLVKPVKQRILLKMYIVAMFMNGRRQKIAKEELIQPAIEKVWQTDLGKYRAEKYYEDIYPSRDGSLFERPMTGMSHYSIADSTCEDDLILMEIEEFTTKNPIPDEVKESTPSENNRSAILDMPEHLERQGSPGLQFLGLSTQEMEQERSSPLPGEVDV